MFVGEARDSFAREDRKGVLFVVFAMRLLDR